MNDSYQREHLFSPFCILNFIEHAKMIPENTPKANGELITRAINAIQEYSRHPSVKTEQDLIFVTEEIEKKVDRKRYSRGGYIKMPFYVQVSMRLSTVAKQVYMMILYHARKKTTCFPTHDRLAFQIGVKRNRVIEALRELKTYELVDWTKQGYKKPNMYRVLSEQPFLKDEEEKYLKRENVFKESHGDSEKGQ